MKSIRQILVLAFFAASLALQAAVPNTHEIDLAFAFEGSNRECYTNVYPYLDQIFRSRDDAADDDLGVRFSNITGEWRCG